MDDLISRQAAINAANEWLMDCFKVKPQDRSCGLIRRLEDLQSVQQTLYGYPLEHLAFIARVMEREGVTPEDVARMLDDTGAVVRRILEEIQRQAESVFERREE